MAEINKQDLRFLLVFSFRYSLNRDSAALDITLDNIEKYKNVLEKSDIESMIYDAEAIKNDIATYRLKSLY